MMDELTPPQIQNQNQNRTWEILCHLSALIALLGVPFGNIIAPLIIWLLKKQDSSAVDAHGKESLNFQISMTIYTVVAGLSCFLCVGFVLLPAVLIANLVLVIIASIKASDGEVYRYPLTIRFIS